MNARLRKRTPGLGRAAFIAAAALVAGGLLFGASPAGAAPPFQLDGNAVHDEPGHPPGDDWDLVNDSGGTPLAKTGLIVDRPEPTFAQFTGGGSKDQLDITSWRHRSGTPPAKDDLTNAYAAAYTNEDNGHFILVFGMDRYDTSGDAQLGFWFLQGAVQPVAGGTFSGAHAINDILVLVNFSNGGSTPNIEVFRWNGTTAVPVPGSAGQVLCTSGFIPLGQNHCGITNSASVEAPWNYENKDVGVTSQFPPGAFFEGAVDLTALNINACITNFLAESRSSTSITAVLKDFATPSGGFNVCGVEVTKQCANPRLNAAETAIIYDITGKVTAKGATIYNVGLSDNPAADGAFQEVDCPTFSTPTGSSFPLTSLTGETCYKNTITVPITSNGPSDQITATANTNPGGTGVSLTDQASAQCPPLQISPAIDVIKDCKTSVAVQNSTVIAKVTVSGKVCNTGDSKLTNVTVDDLNVTTSPDPLLNGVTLNKGACMNYSGTYVPSAALNGSGLPETDPGKVIFKDSVRATGTDVLNQSVTPDTDEACCPLCPGGEGCPTPP